MERGTIRVTDNEAELRYEAWSGDALAGHIRYTIDGDVITLVHTEVEPKLEGKGIGGELVRGALDDAQARGLRVRPLCRFVAVYVKRHPEYADLVA